MKKSKKIKFLIFTCLLVLLNLQMINAERLPVKTFTSADGLGSGFVDYLMRDSRGFMWFCTRDGLSRFDGSRFVTYQIGSKDSPPGIESIFETRDGMYWISTTGGTYRFDPNAISQPDAATPRLNAEFISESRGQFFEDSQGTLWLTTNGLSRLRQQDGKSFFEQVKLNLPTNANIGFNVSDIDETADGSLWFATTWGLIRLLPDKKTVFYPFDTTLNSGNSSMIADKTGRIWLTLVNKLIVIKPESIETFADAGQINIKKLEPTAFIELKPEENVRLPDQSGEVVEFTSRDVNQFVENSYAKRIYQTSDGNIWITAENYLLQFDDRILHLHSEKEGLPNVMTRMAEDAAGNLWIGSHAGLARLDRHGLVTFGTADGTNSSRFFAINEDSNGALYFAARDFYLNRFEGGKFQVIHPAIQPNSQFLWTSRFAFRASNGDWWILTSEKLYRFSGMTDFTQLNNRQPSATYTKNDGLMSNGMFQIFEDSGGAIWISTRGINGTAQGLSRLKNGAEKFQMLTEAEGFPPDKSVSSYAEDTHGNLWFGFYEGGLGRLVGERFEIFDEKNGLPAGLITDLHVDRKGRLWLGSSIGGLLRLDDTNAQNPTFVKYTTANGLTGNNIRTLTEDRFGRIYLGTASGVDRFSPDTERVKHYSVNDGLAADFVVDSHCDKNGNLWFATNDGISRLVPLPEEKTTAPRIFLGGLRIAGIEQQVSDLGNTEIEKGELSHTENNLQIEFFGIDFRAGEILRYQYKLEGADTDWSEPTEQRTVTFANLQPATYHFLVRAINSEGVTSEDPAIVSFKILPPIWARWWFIALCAIGAALLVAAFYRYRLAYLREINKALVDAKLAEENLRKLREERLAELEKVRSRIATDLHDDIGASLTQIAILSEVAQAQNKKGNGAFSEPLKKISTVSNELVCTMSDIVWSINPTKDHISDLVQRMRRFASDSLSAKGIAFHFNSPPMNDDIPLGTNMRRELFLVFKEAVNNIVKHSEAKSVNVEFQNTADFLCLKIIDDGKGFDAQQFNDSGNGIVSMKKRAAEINGEFQIISENGQGTEILLKLPLLTKYNSAQTTRTGGDN